MAPASESARPIRIALYSRCATDRAGALEAQEASLRAAAAEMPVPHIVVAAVRDPAESGLTLDRPGLRALISAAARGAFDVVMVTSHDRLSRSHRDHAHLRQVLAGHGVRVTTPEEDREPALAALAALLTAAA